MAFKLAIAKTYKSKIIVEILNQQGKHEKSDFMAEFTHVTMDELDELRKLPQKEVLHQVLVGWTGLLDEQNEPVLYNPVNVEALLAIPQAFAALSEAFWASIFKAKEKN
jgi:hypothetical protein